MPYRDSLPENSQPCFRHPSSPARGACTACTKAICEICEVYFGADLLCPYCGQRARRMRLFARGVGLFVGLLLLCGVAGALGYVLTREPPFDYGVHKDDVVRLENALKQSPCAHAQMVSLAEVMLQAGDNRGTIARIQRYFDKCGPDLRLRWSTYTAHERLGEHDLAIADATLLINDAPTDKDYWWWRGMAYKAKGDLERAAADFKQAITVEPRLQGIPFNLADTYEALGRLCDAMKPIEQFLIYHPNISNRVEVDARLSRLNRAGNCGRTYDASRLGGSADTEPVE